MAKLICPNCKEILDSMNKRLEFCPYCGQKLFASSESDSTITEKSLIERMYIFLADSEFENADLYSERILDINPKCAEAYLGKFMAEFKICSIEDIKLLDSSITKNIYFKHTLEYADNTFKNKITDCLSVIYEKEKDEKYLSSLKQMENSAINEETLIALLHTFNQELSGYKNADKLAEQAKNLLSQKAEQYIKKDSISSHRHAIKILNILATSNEKDSKAQYCQQRIEAIKRKNKKLTVINIVAIFLLAIILSYTFYFDNLFKYNKALHLAGEQNYKEAICLFQKLDDFRNSEEMEKYCQALLCMDEENYRQSIALFNDIRHFEDSDTKINEIQSDEKWIKTCERGDYITLGAYEQDNDISNGKERVEWLVLDKQNDTLLVISKYALDGRQFHFLSKYKKEIITWENSDIRQWMNEPFMNTLFTEEEKEKIITSTVPAHENPQKFQYSYLSTYGNDTQDNLFLLSADEANKYFASDLERICSPTKYAVAHGVWESNKLNCCWWLRTVGRSQDYTVYVSINGELNLSGYYDDYDNYGVRPAMWISIK